MNEMTLKEFLYAYADNIVESMAGHDCRMSTVQVICGLCPFCELCHNDNGDIPCEQFILNNLSDGNQYKAK